MDVVSDQVAILKKATLGFCRDTVGVFGLRSERVLSDVIPELQRGFDVNRFIGDLVILLSCEISFLFHFLDDFLFNFLVDCEDVVSDDVL